ncbi:MAG: flagellar protein FlgN [Deltaproteobacteria bacterium]|nr:flagellar protein FlgN [Deltaproteobacteria bacterium]
MLVLELIELLKQEFGLYESLLQILQDEKASLVKRSSEEMYALVNKKETVIAKIKAVCDATQDCMKRLAKEKGLNPQDVTLSNIITHEVQPYSAILNGYQSKLSAIANSIKELNEINGRVINMSLENVKKSLNFLRGFTNSLETYKPSGKLSPISIGPASISKGV